MKIDGYNKGLEFTAKIAAKLNKEAQEETKAGAAKKKDTLEISDDAKILMQKEASKADLGAIREKISNGFYNSEEVLDKVAAGVLKDLEE